MIISPFIRTPYNYDVDAASDETATDFTGTESLTQQHMHDECDISLMMERYALTGELPSANVEPKYGDFSGTHDYHSLLTAVRNVEERFASLSDSVRDRFNNDPAAYVDFITNPDNRHSAFGLQSLASGLSVGSTEPVSTASVEASTPSEPA